MFKTQNNEYNYIYVENYIYKKFKEVVEIYKKQIKNHSVLAKINKVCIICTPKCDAFKNSFFPLQSLMKCCKPNRLWMVILLYIPLHSLCIVFASFGNLVNVIHEYELIQVVSSSYMVSTMVLSFSELDRIELGFLQQQSFNQGETIC